MSAKTPNLKRTRNGVGAEAPNPKMEYVLSLEGVDGCETQNPTSMEQVCRNPKPEEEVTDWCKNPNPQTEWVRAKP